MSHAREESSWLFRLAKSSLPLRILEEKRPSHSQSFGLPVHTSHSHTHRQTHTHSLSEGPQYAAAALERKANRQGDLSSTLYQLDKNRLANFLSSFEIEQSRAQAIARPSHIRTTEDSKSVRDSSETQIEGHSHGAKVGDHQANLERASLFYFSRQHFAHLLIPQLLAFFRLVHLVALACVRCVLLLILTRSCLHSRSLK